MSERILIVAPSWVGDAILSEPLVARLAERSPDALIDALAPPWCAPVYTRMRGIRRVIDNPIGHGQFDLAGRRALARSLRGGYDTAYVLPNSWKSALIPWLARVRTRIGYRGESRWGLLTDARRLDRKAMPRLVDRFVALADEPRRVAPTSPAPVLVADAENRRNAAAALALDLAQPVAVLCPGAEYGPAKRWPAAHFAALAQRFLAEGMQVWLIGSPRDRADAAAVIAAAGPAGEAIRDLCGRTDLGTAIDLLAGASVVISNDSGLMHAAAAVGAPLVALFGSSSPEYTPPLSPRAAIARIEISCSPCFQRECPLGHFRCMRELDPVAVYHLARTGARRAPP
jgi:heptosyltransferase-2